ncbi:MAG: tRNA (adenosine(37)-N6)-threonylcarbamoyltransferase complex dimerization subunit type 1 TsaB, partial [Phenylobacterium sp.]|nr:tRNA (adenosine(37)-N6)-threonylcarbamoyltransferase complex dimerization subunit type 1 TsaB [Phenylobacterium sp.]
MITLGLDTCLDACSVAVLEHGVVRAQASHPMGRGHQEAIAPLTAEVMAQASLAFAELNRIGVTIGPGSFTGLRVGLAFAKGLGAALGRPVVGVGTLAALAEPLGDDLVFALIDARRGQVYLQAFAGGRALMAPDALDVATAAARVAELSGGRQAVLAGSGAALLADLMPGARLVSAPACDPAAVARLAAAQT